ncbi:MAG: hypothetical protein ACJAS9_003393 [Polaribacter sp.]
MDIIDPILFRGTERIIVVLGAIIFAYMGYKLFLFGVNQGRGKLEVKSEVFKVIFSGSGPGLFFMAFGGVILVFSLTFGGATNSSVTALEKKGIISSISELQENLNLYLSSLQPIFVDYERIQTREIDKILTQNNERMKILQLSLSESGGLTDEIQSKINSRLVKTQLAAASAVKQIQKQTKVALEQQKELLEQHKELELIFSQFKSKISELK